MKRIVIWLAGLLVFSAHSAHPAGTIEKIDRTGTVYLGYRENSIPFSLVLDNHPAGYSIDLCNAIVAAISAEIGKEIHVEYRPVNPHNRFLELVSQHVDFLCGSSTITEQRQKQVAFSPVIFVAGIKILVKQDSTVVALNDLRDKTVALTRDTTALTVIQDHSERQRLNISYILSDEHNGSIKFLLTQKVDAFINDDVLLHGWLAHMRMADKYRIVGDSLSYEPYGLVFRKDDLRLADLVERTFWKLAHNGEIYRIYEKWFIKPLPSGGSLEMPMSAELEDNFRSLALLAVDR